MSNLTQNLYKPGANPRFNHNSIHIGTVIKYVYLSPVEKMKNQMQQREREREKKNPGECVKVL
jgi:hypothetical protein